MSTNSGKNLQDTFLNNVRKNKISVTIFLVNGVKLQGIVTWFDSFCILLRRSSHAQLVYKHAVSTIMPVQPVMLYDGEDAEAAAFEAENSGATPPLSTGVSARSKTASVVVETVNGSRRSVVTPNQETDSI